MICKYAGTQTENLQLRSLENLKFATSTLSFSRAKKMVEQIADLFLKTADNEKEHAKMWYKELYGIEILETETAADGENYEWTDMYVQFAKTAKEEGFLN